MKKIFILLYFLIASTIAFSQGGYTPQATWFNFTGRQRFSTMLRPPLDTLSAADTGSIASKNGNFYFKDQTGYFVRMAKYSDLSGGSGGFFGKSASDESAAENRTFKMHDTYSFTFDSVNSFQISRNGVARILMHNISTSFFSPDGNNSVQTSDVLSQLKISGSNAFKTYTDSSSTPKRISYESNIHGSFTQYSLIDKAWGDSAYGGSTGLHLAITTDNVLPKSDTIDIRGFQWRFLVNPYNSSTQDVNTFSVYANDSNRINMGSGAMRIIRSNFPDITFQAHARTPTNGITTKFGFGYDSTGQGEYGGGGHAYLDMRDSVATFVLESGGSVDHWFFTKYYTKAPGDVILGYSGNGKVMVYGTGAPDVTSVGDASLRKFNVYGTSFFNDTALFNGQVKFLSLSTDNTATQVLGKDGSGNSIWRDVSTISGVSTNIYTADGSLTSNRTMTLNSKSFSIEQAGAKFVELLPTIGLGNVVRFGAITNGYYAEANTGGTDYHIGLAGTSEQYFSIGSDVKMGYDGGGTYSQSGVVVTPGLTVSGVVQLVAGGAEVIRVEADGVNRYVYLPFTGTGSTPNGYSLRLADNTTGRVSWGLNNAGIQFEDEGVALGAAGNVDVIDFVGSGVTATRSTNTLTVTIAGTSSPKLNEIIAADGTASINSGDNAIDWGWNSLSTNTGMKFSSTSTAANNNTQKLFALDLSGTNSNSNQTTYTEYVSNAHAGTGAVNHAIYATATNGATNVAIRGDASSSGLSNPGAATGVYGSAASGGYGVFGAAAGSGTGVRGESSTGSAVVGIGGGNAFYGLTTAASSAIAYLQDNRAATNTVLNALILDGQSSGTTAAGFGRQIQWLLELNDNTSGEAGSISTKLTTATAASYVSSMTFRVASAATMADVLVLNGNKSINNPGYGQGNFTAGTPVYVAAWDASGNVMETSLSGGSGEVNTASNLGGGLANYDSKSVADLRFNSFTTSDFNLASNLISIDYTNGQAASASLKGFLTSADWTTFNSKVSATDRRVAFQQAVGTDANITAAAGTAYHLPAATLSTNRTIDVTNLNTDEDYVEFYNNESGYTWSFTGATVYDSDGSTTVTELLANTNSVIRRVNGKLMISKL